jgi:RNase H-fold protein (predicted Holliday junction resolvase)
VIANEVVGLVFGLPLMDGRETPFSRQVLYFIEALSAAALQRPQLSESSSSSLSYKLIPLATLPCTFEDESFSSSEARALSGLTSQRRGVLLKRKDSLAACLILQRFLEDGDDH